MGHFKKIFDYLFRLHTILDFLNINKGLVIELNCSTYLCVFSYLFKLCYYYRVFPLATGMIIVFCDIFNNLVVSLFYILSDSIL